MLFLTTLPLLFLIIVGTGSIFGVLQQIIKDKKTCRNELLNGQVRAGQELRKLLELNPRAEKLYRRLQSLKEQELECLLAGGGACVAAIRLSIIKVEMDRTLLSLRQQQLLMLGKGHLEAASRKITNQIRDHRFSIENNIAVHLDAIQTEGDFQLAVEPEYPDTAPPYKEKTNFSEVQKVGITWSKKMNFPLVGTNRKLSFGCAATLKNQSSEYLAVLKVVRPWSNLHSAYY